jgi:hypothetical protein
MDHGGEVLSGEFLVLSWLAVKIKTCRRAGRGQVNKKQMRMFFELPAAA